MSLESPQSNFSRSWQTFGAVSFGSISILLLHGIVADATQAQPAVETAASITTAEQQVSPADAAADSATIAGYVASSATTASADPSHPVSTSSAGDLPQRQAAPAPATTPTAAAVPAETLGALLAAIPIASASYDPATAVPNPFASTTSELTALKADTLATWQMATPVVDDRCLFAIACPQNAQLVAQVQTAAMATQPLPTPSVPRATSTAALPPPPPNYAADPAIYGSESIPLTDPTGLPVVYPPGAFASYPAPVSVPVNSAGMPLPTSNLVSLPTLYPPGTFASAPTANPVGYATSYPTSTVALQPGYPTSYPAPYPASAANGAIAYPGMGQAAAMGYPIAPPANYPPPNGNFASLPATVSPGATSYPYPAGYPGTAYVTGYPTYPTGYTTGYPTGYPTTYPVGYPASYAAGYPASYPMGYPANTPSMAGTQSYPSGVWTGPTTSPMPYPGAVPTGYVGGGPALIAYPIAPPSPNYPIAGGAVNYPTNYPTGYPTNYSAGYPSGYPANYPSGYPTGYPAGNTGTIPAPAPTGFPTNYPPGTLTGYPPNAPGYPVAPGGNPYAAPSPASGDRSPTDGASRPPLLGSAALSGPNLHAQGVYVYEGDESSARARLTGTYPLTPHLLFGATLDLTTGNAFSDTPEQGFNVNELYFVTSLQGLPNLRFALGQLDLTSYFDRNSFAKDGASQFFNTVFQTNPALSATGIGSRPGFLADWKITDTIAAKAAIFSSGRNLNDFSLDGFAGEVGFRYGNAIIRGTYVSDRDGGRRTAFRELFDVNRGNGKTGPLSSDREEAYGINAEVFIPSLKLGLFARYGHQTNVALGEDGDTYSAGLTFLDLITPGDRLGLAYGRDLSNDNLRRQADRAVPDVLELYYDFRLLPNIRLGVSLQERNGFSETIAGFRIRSDFDLIR